MLAMNPLLKHLLDGKEETLVSLAYTTLNETHCNPLLKHLLDGDEDTIVSLAYNTLNETHYNPLLKHVQLIFIFFIFLSHLEEKWLANCPLVFYRWCVDGTFISFSDSSLAPQFLQCTNQCNTMTLTLLWRLRKTCPCPSWMCWLNDMRIRLLRQF